MYKNKKRYGTKNTYGIDSELKKLIDKLDNMITPKQEPFKEETGQDLKKYVERFEEYCKDNFKGKNYLCIGEL